VALTLEQRLALFNPAEHGGEVMVASQALGNKSDKASYILCHQPKFF